MEFNRNNNWNNNWNNNRNKYLEKFLSNTFKVEFIDNISFDVEKNPLILFKLIQKDFCTFVSTSIKFLKF